jgi:NAD(P)-dependent dehydrogenase (short-subunit alcohol dehydrogenase family)
MQTGHPRRLEARRIIITGAVGGQGMAVAERFAAEGARLVLTDLDGGALEALRLRLEGAGAEAISIAADVRDEDAVAGVVAAAAEAFGGLDVLYNNAAMRLVGRDGTVDAIDRAAWDDTFAVNVTGTFLFCKHALFHLLRSSAPVILNVSSTAGTGGDSEAHAYGASKGALIALTKGIAQRWGADGLRAVVICPGLVETPMLEAALAGEAMTRALLDSVALRRVARPDEIATCAAFLASDEASYITGCVFEVSGGLAK